ncbi:MAG: hypothetical protein KDB54_02400 [Solirubrobacterales bacterium]|nr:hypothetical protein [Solirubrobacterales bacterium]
MKLAKLRSAIRLRLLRFHLTVRSWSVSVSDLIRTVLVTWVEWRGYWLLPLNISSIFAAQHAYSSPDPTFIDVLPLTILWGLGGAVTLVAGERLSTKFGPITGCKAVNLLPVGSLKLRLGIVGFAIASSLALVGLALPQTSEAWRDLSESNMAAFVGCRLLLNVVVWSGVRYCCTWLFAPRRSPGQLAGFPNSGHRFYIFALAALVGAFGITFYLGS